MEPNEAAGPAPGSITDIAARLALWGRRAPKGLARVEFDSDFSRQAVITDLRQRLDEASIPLHEIELPRRQPADQIVQFLLNCLGAVEKGVVFVTGWATAFPRETPLSESLRVLNYNRENLAQFPICQVWWLTSAFAETFVQTIPDLDSWFMVRLRLTEIIIRPTDEGPVAKSDKQFADPELARKTSAELVARFERAINTHSSAAELIRLASAAIDLLSSVDLQDARQETAKTLLNKIIQYLQENPADSGETYNQPEEWLRVLGNQYLDTPHSLGNLANLHEAQGNLDQAEALFMAAFDVIKTTPYQNFAEVDFAYSELVSFYARHSRFHEAEELCEQWLETVIKVLGPGNFHSSYALNMMAIVYLAQEKYHEAERAFRGVTTELKKSSDITPIYKARTLNRLSRLYHSLGRYAEAEEIAERAKTISGEFMKQFDEKG